MRWTRENPRRRDLFLAEDFVGRVKKVGGKCHRSTCSRRVVERLLLLKMWRWAVNEWAQGRFQSFMSSVDGGRGVRGHTHTNIHIPNTKLQATHNAHCTTHCTTHNTQHKRTHTNTNTHHNTPHHSAPHLTTTHHNTPHHTPHHDTSRKYRGDYYIFQIIFLKQVVYLS